MRAVLAFLSLGLPVVSATALSRLLFGGFSRAVRLLLWIVAYSVLVFLPVHLLGALELAGAGLRPSLPAIVFVQAVLAALGLAALFRAGRPAPPAADPPPRVPIRARFSRLAIAGLAIAAAGYAIFALNAVTSYPNSWDGNLYHLPIALRWLQDGSVRVDPEKGWLMARGANGEIFMMSLLGAGPPCLVFLSQVLPAIGLAVAAYLIARRLGACRDAAVASTLVLASIPIVTYQTFNAYVDLFASSYLFMGLALFLAREPGPNAAGSNRQNAILLLFAALSCGIALGTKPVYVFYAGIFAATALGLFLRRPAARFGLSLPAAVLLVAAGLLIPSAFWYARSVAATGNPLYPAALRVGKTQILRGISSDRISLHDHNAVKSLPGLVRYPWTEEREGEDYYSVDSGLGAAFATFVPLGFVSLAILAVRRRARPLAVVLLVWVAIGAVVWRLLMGSVLRYGLPLILLACILSCMMLEALLSERRRAASFLLLASLATAFGVSAFGPVRSMLWRAHEGAWSHRKFYALPPIVERLPAGTRLLNWTGDGTLNFALAGARLENRVVNSFEAPSRLTPEFLEREVDYVVERWPAREGGEGDDLTSLGAELAESVRGGIARDGARSAGWRVWKVARNSAGQPGADSSRPPAAAPAPGAQGGLALLLLILFVFLLVLLLPGRRRLRL